MNKEIVEYRSFRTFHRQLTTGLSIMFLVIIMVYRDQVFIFFISLYIYISFLLKHPHLKQKGNKRIEPSMQSQPKTT